MNIVDLLIIMIVVFGAVIGFKHGVFRQLISALSFILSVIFAFIFKNKLSILLYEHLPFFEFGGLFKGISVLNIIIYEFLAFLILLGIFLLIFRILKIVTNIFERILRLTFVLAIPSKLLGIVVGALQYFVIVFITLYILSFPVFQMDVLNKSKYAQPILNNTPILSSFAKQSMNVFNEFADLKEKYENEENTEQFNDEALDLLLKYKVVSIDSVKKLIEDKKIEVNSNILEKYEEA